MSTQAAQVINLVGDADNLVPDAKTAVSIRGQGEKPVLQTKDVLERIKDELSLSTDNELAEFMGLGVRRIHNWKHRNTVPTEEIVGLCGREGLDLQYILTGERPSSVKHGSTLDTRAPSRPAAVEDACNNSPETPRSTYTSCPCGQPRMCPPYKTFTEYGTDGQVLNSFSSPQIVDVLSPGTNWLVHSLGIQPEKFLQIKVIGDNMAPWLHDGDLVFCDTNLKSTVNGGCLVLRYADGTMMVRRVTRTPEGTLRATCDANCCEPEIVDPNDNDSYPIIVGRVIRRVCR